MVNLNGFNEEEIITIRDEIIKQKEDKNQIINMKQSFTKIRSHSFLVENFKFDYFIIKLNEQAKGNFEREVNIFIFIFIFYFYFYFYFYFFLFFLNFRKFGLVGLLI